MGTTQKIIVIGLILILVMGSLRTIRSTGDHGGTIYNGHEYKLFTDTKTWHDAKAGCEAQGGHLVTITSSEENNFVDSLLISDKNVWIGFTDEQNEGDWQWVTGEMVTYENWDPGPPEPNGGTDENHAEMYSGGLWNDAPGDFDGNYYVCEWDISSREEFKGHDYQLINDYKTWTEAKVDCENRDGYLVTITSSEENDFVSSLMESIDSNEIWIGFTDELNEGDWQWVTAEEVTYSNWNLGEPNDAGGEDYAEMSKGGFWNDNGPPSNPDHKLPYVCEWNRSLSSKENGDISDTPTITTPSFELVTWIFSMFILISIIKTVRKSKNNKD